MEKYCLGFMFRKHWSEVLLIKKSHPDWQRGKYNGIGGHLLPNEVSGLAMRREFKEEADARTPEWHHYLTLRGTDYNIDIFCSHVIEGMDAVKSTTEEKIRWFSVDGLPKNVIPNLRWMIPMALSFRLGEHARQFIIEQF